MHYKIPRRTVRTGPEAKGALRIRRYLEARGWLVIKLHGGKYQSGLPDFFIIHIVHGLKWMETKAKGEKLRRSQLGMFGLLDKFGQEVFVLTDEQDYPKLFNKPNWREFAL